LWCAGVATLGTLAASIERAVFINIWKEQLMRIAARPIGPPTVLVTGGTLWVLVFVYVSLKIPVASNIDTVFLVALTLCIVVGTSW